MARPAAQHPRNGRRRGRRRPADRRGLLVFATEPTDFLASGSIEAARYRDTRLSSDDLVHAERLGGPVSDQIDAGIGFVARFIGGDDSPAGGPHYDLDVVDEAIVNAVAHRDYAIAGSKIRLFLFADRLELYSPGKLPNTITLDDMPYRTFTRNQLLVSFLSRIRSKRTGRVFLESRGEGVRKILQDGEAHSGRRPEYALFGDELRLTLWAKVTAKLPWNGEYYVSYGNGRSWNDARRYGFICGGGGLFYSRTLEVQTQDPRWEGIA